MPDEEQETTLMILHKNLEGRPAFDNNNDTEHLSPSRALSLSLLLSLRHDSTFCFTIPFSSILFNTTNSTLCAFSTAALT